MFLTLLLSVPAFITIWLVMTYIEHVWNLRKYPKGPFPLPVIGNLMELSGEPWIDFANLAKIYGNTFSLSFGMFMNQSTIISFWLVHDGIIFLLKFTRAAAMSIY